MGKFKVGDKVALATRPCDYLGCIASIDEDDGVAIVEIPPRYVHAFIIKLDQLTLYDETDMTDDEIYTMLKPKMEKAGACTDMVYWDLLDEKKAIALAYRSGYLRAKKGRPFKIGGNKK